MGDLPEIPFVRKLCAGLTEEEIKEQEKIIYDLCLIAKEVHMKWQLTKKNKDVS